MAEFNGGSTSADHLCVLVHGLWGNPKHMASIAQSLRAQYSEDKLHLLVTQRNSGNLTYDGIETGGERVCAEIEEQLAAINGRGGEIKKLSVVGYSQGGLVARYAIGLLYARGTLQKLECMNFTAFASPFLGARSPLKGFFGRFFNGVGANTLSMSGKQMFGVDKFRDTGRPLLSVLADPDSIFMNGLAMFKRKSLYCNIVNDRTVVFYTANISKTDPYNDMDGVSVKYAKGYEDVILDPIQPFSQIPQEHRKPNTLSQTAMKWLKRIPFAIVLIIMIPVGLSVYLVNSGIQFVRSAQRIALHEKSVSPLYRVSMWKEIRGTIEDAYENMNNRQNQEYLSSDSEGDEDLGATTPADKKIIQLERRESNAAQPTLALTPDQFEMVKNLNELGWRKNHVYVQKVQHSHAAIIRRSTASRYDDGKIVLKHFINEEFLT